MTCSGCSTCSGIGSDLIAVDGNHGIFRWLMRLRWRFRGKIDDSFCFHSNHLLLTKYLRSLVDEIVAILLAASNRTTDFDSDKFSFYILIMLLQLNTRGIGWIQCPFFCCSLNLCYIHSLSLGFTSPTGPASFVASPGLGTMFKLMPQTTTSIVALLSPTLSTQTSGITLLSTSQRWPVALELYPPVVAIQ